MDDLSQTQKENLLFTGSINPTNEQWAAVLGGFARGGLATLPHAAAYMPQNERPVDPWQGRGYADFAHGVEGAMAPPGRLMDGPGDGLSDSIPAQIGGAAPAALGDGEFVVPADAVSHLGNGSSDAGAQRLQEMIDRVRQARTGSPTQGRRINPNQFMPG